VRALTARIEAGLRAVTLNFASLEESRLATRAADLYAEDERVMPGRRISARASRCVRPSRGLRRRARATAGARRAARQRWLRATTRCSRRAGCATIRSARAIRSAWRPGMSAAARSGSSSRCRSRRSHAAELRALPRAGSRRALRRPAPRPAGHLQDPDRAALAPLCWAVFVGRRGCARRPVAALLTAIAAPTTGLFALRFHELNESFWVSLRAWLTLRLLPRRAEELRALRLGSAARWSSSSRTRDVRVRNRAG